MVYTGSSHRIVGQNFSTKPGHCFELRMRMSSTRWIIPIERVVCGKRKLQHTQGVQCDGFLDQITRETCLVWKKKTSTRSKSRSSVMAFWTKLLERDLPAVKPPPHHTVLEKYYNDYHQHNDRLFSKIKSFSCRSPNWGEEKVPNFNHRQRPPTPSPTPSKSKMGSSDVKFNTTPEFKTICIKFWNLYPTAVLI